MTAPENKLDTIRKLLVKAEGAATEHEADAYNRKAERLMAAHGIDQALLAESGERADEIGETRIVVDDPYSQGKGRMLGWIAMALGCRAVLHWGRGGKRRILGVTVFGHASDRERVELLYTSLLLQAVTQLTRIRPDDTAFGSGESTAAYRRSWLYGYGQRVSARLRDAEQAAREQAAERTSTAGTSAELVLVDRHAAVDRAYGEVYGNLTKARRPQHSSASGYRDGDHAGRKASIGSGRGVAARRRPALEG